MNKEDKSLLVQDLCARLPYGVICFAPDYEYGDIGKLWCVEPFEDLDPPITIQYPKGNTITKFCSEIKPYLRPMSSMTEEETDEYWDNINLKCPEMPVGEIPSIENIGKCSTIVLNWLLENHFDFMGLIPKDLAIAVTEENNPYKNYNYD